MYVSGYGSVLLKPYLGGLRGLRVSWRVSWLTVSPGKPSLCRRSREQSKRL